MSKKKMTLDQALALADTYAVKGEVVKARRLYLMVLNSFPQNKKAKKGLGILQNETSQKTLPNLTDQIDHLIALYSSGKLKDALNEAMRLSQSQPGIPFIHSVLASCYVDSGQPKAAVKSYKKALKIKPDYAEAHNNLGAVLGDLGQPDEAVASFKQAVKIKPEYAEAHHNLGNILRGLGHLDAAVSSYQRVLKIKPDHAETLYNLGLAQSGLGHLDAAVASFERALEIKPDYVEAHHNLGLAQSGLGHLDAAVASFERALEIKPDYVAVHNNLGIVLGDLGLLDAEVASYEHALEIKPDCAVAHYNLGILQTYRSGDARIDIMERLLSSSNMDESSRTYLGFALAKAHDDLGEYDKSFNYLKEANRLRKKALEYDIGESKRFFSRIKEVFYTQRDFFDAASDEEHSAIRPVFIVGMLRSGTSLVEQILASHPRVFGAGELETMTRLLNPIFSKFPDRITGQQNRQVLQHEIGTIRNAYLNELMALKVPEKIVTDKMPGNFMWIGYILSAFPEAKIINLNRDPRATCWSIYKHYLISDGNKYVSDMEDVAQYYNLYIDLMSFWREHFPDKIYDICYEDLTENQEEETRKLLEYCDLDWQEDCLNYHKTKRVCRTPSAAQVRKKMYQGSSKAWERYEAQLQPMIKLLGF